jgi:cation transport ATPase
MLTGESLRVTKDLGSKVFGGTILVQGSIIFRVDKLIEDATYN